MGSDSNAPLPPGFAAIFERLKGAMDVDRLEHAASQLGDESLKMQRIFDEQVDGSSSSGQVTLRCDLNMNVLDVIVEPGLTQRPSVNTIHSEVVEALNAAQRLARDVLRAKMKSELGVTISDEPQVLMDEAKSAQANMQSAIAPILGMPLVGEVMKEIMARTEAFQAAVFTGSSEPVTVKLKASGELDSLDFDHLATRETDNVSLSDALKQAFRDATKARDDARTALADVSQHPELDVSRYQDMVATLQRDIAAKLRDM